MTTELTRALGMALTAAAVWAWFGCSDYQVRDVSADADTGAGTDAGTDARSAPGVDACAGDMCACEGENTCEFDCPRDDCALECHDGDECGAICEDSCQYTCAEMAACALSCGDACTASCSDSDSCEVTCGEDCDVMCTNVASCIVMMQSGSAICAFVAQCEILCDSPAGPPEPAEDCGGGVFACGSCPLATGRP